jgi:hypothetical protein
MTEFDLQEAIQKLYLLLEQLRFWSTGITVASVFIGNKIAI